MKQQTQELVLNKPLCFQFLYVRDDSIYLPLPTSASRMRNEINPCNYMRKSNHQFIAKSQTVLLDLCGCTMVRQEALRASTSLRQSCLTYADALHFEIEKSCGTRAPNAQANES